MFSTVKERLILGVYIFILISIPIGSYLASERTNTKVAAKQVKETTTITKPLPTFTPGEQSKKLSLSTETQKSYGSTGDLSSSSSAEVTFSSTMNFKVILEGRPAANQAAKMFVGIMEGALQANPKYLLMFNVDLPASGEFKGLSLAGLNSGSSYTAVIKGPSQIATSSAFVATPTVTNLNDGQPLILLSGDLNEDNTINNADYAIATTSFKATPSSPNWNENADLNKDGIINSIDLSIIAKNFGKGGATGSWSSQIPKPATNSGSVNTPIGGSGGYWFWIPKL